MLYSSSPNCVVFVDFNATELVRFTRGMRLVYKVKD